MVPGGGLEPPWVSPPAPTAPLLHYPPPAPARMPPPLPAPGRRAHDGREGLGIQARAADEGTVDFRLGDELADVLRRDAAPVEHARLLRPSPDPPGQPAADQPADAVRLRAGGRPSRADGPDGLVGDHKAGSAGRIEPAGSRSPPPRD